MTLLEDVRDFPSEAKEIQKDSDVQWADGYNRGKPQEPAPLFDWNTVFQNFLGNSADHGELSGETAVAARLVQAGNIFIRLNEFWREAIQSLPKLHQGNGNSAQFDEMVDRWLESCKDIFKKSTESSLARQTEEIFDSWTRIVKMNQKANEPVMNPWLEAMPRWSEQSEKIAKGELEAIDDGLRLWREVYGETLGRLFQMPGLGLTKQQNEKISRTYAEFTQFSASMPYLFRYFFDTQTAVLKEVFDQIRQLNIKETTPEAMREIYQIWLTTSENTFHQLFKRQDFCHTVGEVINCMFRLKKQLNELSDQWCAAMAIPSGRDHDKMAMAIQDLRRKVRAQQKTIGALQKHLNELELGRDDNAAAV